MNSKRADRNKGFTLMEVLIAITLFAALLIVVFESLNSIRYSTEMVENKYSSEKKFYIFNAAFSNMIKNISTVLVRNDLTLLNFFKGDKNSMHFISFYPLLANHSIPHLCHVEFNDGSLNYRERLFLQSNRKQVDIDMSEIEPAELFAGLGALEFKYFCWDSEKKKYVWKDEVDTFDDAEMFPSSLKMKLVYNGKERELNYRIFLK